MWVVKIGGSLSRDPLLKQWLQRLLEIGSGRVVIVPGGGSFTDEVRDHQAHWQFGDLQAHNMAVLGMAQFGLMLQGICPALVPVTSDAAIRQALRQAKVGVWLPLEVLREQADDLTNWEVASDSLAAWLANRLNAERLIVVKSCTVDATWTPSELVTRGIVDAQFAAMTRRAAYVVDVLGKQRVEFLTKLLDGA